MLFIFDTAGLSRAGKVGGKIVEEEGGGESRRGLLGRLMQKVRGAGKVESRKQTTHFATPRIPPSRSSSTGSSSSFLSRLSSRTLSTISSSSSKSTFSHYNYDPIASIVSIVQSLRLTLDTNPISLSANQASAFVTKLESIGYHNIRIAQDVRQGVEVGFGRGNLREYLNWVERELEGGKRKGEGLFTSWGFDVSRIIPILTIVLQLLESREPFDVSPFVAALEPLDLTTSNGLTVVFCKNASLEEKREMISDMIMYWQDHSTPLYHLNDFSFYIGLGNASTPHHRAPIYEPYPSESSSTFVLSFDSLESVEEEEEDKLPLALAMDAGSVVEFEGVAVLEQGGGGDVALSAAVIFVALEFLRTRPLPGIPTTPSFPFLGHVLEIVFHFTPQIPQAMVG
ncbi:hypothetical protein BDY24DRAFT_414773 [Mrakia frigida]|uniref:uncharacterized protein n=1 Tax=Mrakia frigida TaxID=29902 RepID=UPI003FCC1B2C